jgi:hypothetical protein
VIQELPYVPETVERVHGRDHRSPHRPLSHGESDRSDLNRRAINRGCLQESFHQIHSLQAEGRRQALAGPDREIVRFRLELCDTCARGTRLHRQRIPATRPFRPHPIPWIAVNNITLAVKPFEKPGHP